jgi:hypothetical protein
MVDMGHTDYNELTNDGHTVCAATRSTGQIEERAPGFSVVTLDHSVVSWKFKPICQWPLVMITTPSDHRLIINPASPNQVVRGPITVRARAWGQEIAFVNLRVDGGEALRMFPLGDAGWSTYWDAARAGLHCLTVEAYDRNGRTTTDAVRVLVNRAADYRLPTCRALDFENALGAWPEKHILGTQLGPNRNGRQSSTREQRGVALMKGSR